MIKAIIFDFDGLILDTETPEVHVWEEIYEEFGLDFPFEKWQLIIGSDSSAGFDPIIDLENKLADPFDKEEITAHYKMRAREKILAQSILPGVKEYIQYAKKNGISLAIASSSPRSWVEGHLIRLKLIENFDVINTADDVEKIKPDPDLYNLTLASLKLTPNEAIVIEDSLNGVIAANTAGIFVLAVPNKVTRFMSFEKADLVLNSLSNMPLEKLIAEVNTRGYL